LLDCNRDKTPGWPRSNDIYIEHEKRSGNACTRYALRSRAVNRQARSFQVSSHEPARPERQWANNFSANLLTIGPDTRCFYQPYCQIGYHGPNPKSRKEEYE
jgi:hypothetical protein